MNFTGGLIHETFSGNDNSAEDISVLGIEQVYPTYTGGEQRAIAAAEAAQADLAAHGVRVAYLERPPQMLPYTMAMIGGTWEDTNIDGPAGGVAPTADCGALNQRHIVYVFASGGQSATSVANVTSQEAGHAWGLDHTLNCDSVMSYCGGLGDQFFSDTCDTLCEIQCQGPNTIGCRLAHEEICGEGSDAQNEMEELTYLFGGNEPDMEPPVVQIDEPEDGAEFPDGADVDLRAFIEDDYGGMGWGTTIEARRRGPAGRDRLRKGRDRRGLPRGLQPHRPARGCLHGHGDRHGPRRERDQPDDLVHRGRPPGGGHGRRRDRGHGRRPAGRHRSGERRRRLGNGGGHRRPSIPTAAARRAAHAPRRPASDRARRGCCCWASCPGFDGGGEPSRGYSTRPFWAHWSLSLVLSLPLRRLST